MESRLMQCNAIFSKGRMSRPFIMCVSHGRSAPVKINARGQIQLMLWESTSSHPSTIDTSCFVCELEGEQSAAEGDGGTFLLYNESSRSLKYLIVHVTSLGIFDQTLTRNPRTCESKEYRASSHVIS